MSFEARFTSNVLAVVALTIANFDARGKYPTWSTLIRTAPFFRARSTSNRSVKENRQQDSFSDQGGKAGALLTGEFRHASPSVSPKGAK